MNRAPGGRRGSRFGIRARITSGSVVIAILVSTAASVLLYQQVERIVRDGEVAVLTSDISPYAESVERDSTKELSPAGDSELIAVIRPDGRPAVNSLPHGLLTLIAPLNSIDTDPHSISSLHVPYIYQLRRVYTPNGVWTIVAARDTKAQRAILRSMKTLLIVGAIVLNVSFAAASWLLATAALAPVGRLRRSAERLAVDGGDELLSVGSARDEIGELAITLNALISELRSAAARERAIVSDASHELRTPLAILRTRLELALSQPATVEQLTADIVAAERMVTRLAMIATSLLDLSRVDAQSVPVRSTVAELGDELADAADRGRIRVSGTIIRVEYRDDTDETISGREVGISTADFGRVLDNLVSNSAAALGRSGTPELGAEIALVLDDDGDDLLLSVADTGGGMDPAFIDHALDRFSRDHTTPGATGAGLGLAIVDAIARLAGGELHFDNDFGSGLTIRVRLPLQ